MKLRYVKTYSGVFLHRLLVADSPTNLVDLCSPDASDARWAFPLRGQWNNQGQRTSENGFTLIALPAQSANACGSATLTASERCELWSGYPIYPQKGCLEGNGTKCAFCKELAALGGKQSGMRVAAAKDRLCWSQPSTAFRTHNSRSALVAETALHARDSLGINYPSRRSDRWSGEWASHAFVRVATVLGNHRLL